MKTEQKDKRHRLDGPAIKCADGSKQWWVDGKRHRIDGPAIEYGSHAIGRPGISRI